MTVLNQSEVQRGEPDKDWSSLEWDKIWNGLRLELDQTEFGPTYFKKKSIFWVKILINVLGKNSKLRLFL